MSEEHSSDKESADAQSTEPIGNTTASSSYKVRGKFSDQSGAGVVGRNTAGSGTPIGVEGTVSKTSDGYGLSTPNDIRVEGAIDTDDTDFSVEAGTIATEDARNVVHGHTKNRVTSGATGGTVGGGGLYDGTLDNSNRVHGNYGTVAGGENNQAGESARDDPAIDEYATVGGGDTNLATNTAATISGGKDNRAFGDSATVSGGSNNKARKNFSAIGGGRDNEAKGIDATVAGGRLNNASGSQSSITGGNNNETTGEAATVAGGIDNVAGGIASFAAGRLAKANSRYAFVWADGAEDDNNNLTPFKSDAGAGPTGENTFHVRCVGGARFVSGVDKSGDPQNGVKLASGGGGWNQLSSRAVKTDVRTVDSQALLENLREIEITTWRYRNQEEVRHVGPMAEAFHESFDVGEDAETINSIDADGVALAAIQGLAERLDQVREQVREKDERIDELEDRLQTLEEQVETTTPSED